MGRATRLCMSFDDPQTFVMIGAAFDVHNELGPGFWSRYTPPPLRSSSGRRGIDYRKEVPLPISYKGELLPMNYRRLYLLW